MNIRSKTPARSRMTHNAGAATAVFSKSSKFARVRKVAPSHLFRTRSALFSQFLHARIGAITVFSIDSALFQKNTRVGIPLSKVLHRRKNIHTLLRLTRTRR